VIVLAGLGLERLIRQATGGVRKAVGATRFGAANDSGFCIDLERIYY
jgi:hypothetical protein